MSEEIKTEVKEKKPMKKWLRNLLVLLAVIVFAGLAVFFVKIYFDHENSKPKFEFPAIDPRPSVTALPQTKEDAFNYVKDLYDKAMNADDVEFSWSTGVDLSGEMKTPFKKEDQDIVLFIRDRAQGQISAFYPNVGGEITATAQNKPEFFFGADDIADYTCEQGRTNDDGTKREEDYYFIDFVLDVSIIDAKALESGKVRSGIEDILSSAMKIIELSIKPETVRVSFKVDRVFDKLLDMNIHREYTVSSSLELQGEYKNLTEGGIADVEFPYKSNESIRFRHYGIRFLEQQVVFKPGDMDALPISVTVNNNASSDEYTITYDISKPDAFVIDNEVVVRVNDKAYEDEPITVKMTVEYNGHTYSDSIIVYVTEKEVPNE